jgi:hypothetical protein
MCHGNNCQIYGLLPFISRPSLQAGGDPAKFYGAQRTVADVLQRMRCSGRLWRSWLTRMRVSGRPLRGRGEGWGEVWATTILRSGDFTTATAIHRPTCILARECPYAKPFYAAAAFGFAALAPSAHANLLLEYSTNNGVIFHMLCSAASGTFCADGVSASAHGILMVVNGTHSNAPARPAWPICSPPLSPSPTPTFWLNHHPDPGPGYRFYRADRAARFVDAGKRNRR